MTKRAWYHQLWAFGVICLAALLFGGLFQPGEWYQALNRAPWSPPNIAFPIVWSALYIMIAFAGYLAAGLDDARLLATWYGQIALNAAWSWIFFGQHWVLIGLINLLLMLILVGYFIVRGLQKTPKLASLLFIPYFVWLCLASSLNAYILIHN